MAPVMNVASSEARKRMAFATSSGSPRRPTGCIRLMASRYSVPPGSSGKRRTRSVRMVPGATALTRMPWSAHSTARCLVMPDSHLFVDPLTPGEAAGYSVCLSLGTHRGSVSRQVTRRRDQHMNAVAGTVRRCRDAPAGRPYVPEGRLDGLYGVEVTVLAQQQPT